MDARTPGAIMAVRHLPGEGQRWALLLHDVGSDHRSFRHQVPAFSPGTDLLVPDLRGHGVSILHHGATATLEAVRADLEVLLGAVGAEQLAVIGQGVGDGIAQELAHRRPGLVQRLVLINGQDHHRPSDSPDRARLHRYDTRRRRGAVETSPSARGVVRVMCHLATGPAPQEGAVEVLFVLVVAVLASGALMGSAWAVGQARRAGRRRARVVLAGVVGALAGLVGAGLLVGLGASLYWLINVVRVFV